METDNEPTRVPEWMKANTEPVTEDELREWRAWAFTPEVRTTRTGNRTIRLLNTIEAFRNGTDTITPGIDQPHRPGTSP